MSKKKNAGGVADHKRRGLKTVLIPLSVEQHALLTQAAGSACLPVSRFAAAALEAAARGQIEEAKENLEKILTRG